MKSNCVRKPVKTCPHCHSDHVRRSHRQTAIDHVLYALGAEIRRCHNCRRRHATFATLAIPLDEPQTLAGIWASFFVMGSGVLACLIFMCWMILQYTDLSG
jgi:hypothetical protein